MLRRIELSPHFSAEKQRVIEQLPYYSVARVNLQSRKECWIEQGLTGEAYGDLTIGSVREITFGQPGLKSPRNIPTRVRMKREALEKLERQANEMKAPLGTVSPYLEQAPTGNSSLFGTVTTIFREGWDAEQRQVV
jgi:hypothetical protein